MKTLSTLVSAILLPLSAFAQTALPEHAQVLARYVGTWELTFSNSPDKTFTERYEWVLSGSFIRKSVSPSNASDANSVLNIQMTQFDKLKNVYRQWGFTSDGAFMEGDGSWDPSSKTLTFTSRNMANRTTFVIKSTVVDANTDNILVTAKDSSGKIISERTAQRKRKK